MAKELNAKGYRAVQRVKALCEMLEEYNDNIRRNGIEDVVGDKNIAGIKRVSLELYKQTRIFSEKQEISSGREF